MQVTAAKGKSNITTSVGNGLNVVATHGDLNVNSKVGDGVSVSVAWGKFNINTKVGDGMNIHAAYARNNVAIQVGNGDFYHLALASSNTESHKLVTLFDNIKQTLLGVTGSQGINFLVNGDEANTSGSYRGRGAINLPEVNALNGFELTEMAEVRSDLATDLHAAVNQLNTPDVSKLKNIMYADEQQAKTRKPNLIVNGDFEAGGQGWAASDGIEVQHPAAAYGLPDDGHGKYVTELDAHANTTIYQDLRPLQAGEVITLDFDFARRAGSTDDNGMEVLWNDQVVFSSSDDYVVWQHKQLVLVAQAGSNRLAFKGTGNSDGRGYILDNVVATSNRSDSAQVKRTSQTSVAGDVLHDKANAEADRQRLMQEREKQLAAIADTQAQLAATDLEALNTNGLAQRNAVKEEEQAVTDELLAKVIALDSLDNQTYTSHQGESGAQWRQDFAGGLLDKLQTQLDRVKETAGQQLGSLRTSILQHQKQVKSALEKSAAGVTRSEQNQRGAQQDINDARVNAEYRTKEAQSQQKRAEQAENAGYNAIQQAEFEAETVAKDSGQKPSHRENQGSGLSEAYQSSAAGHTGSHINPNTIVQGDGRFSQEIPESDDDLKVLADAKLAMERLQIKVAPRDKNAKAISTTSVLAPTELEGLGNARLASDYGLQQNSHERPNAATLSSITARAQKVADIYRWLNSDNDRLMDFSVDDYIPVPGIERVDMEFDEINRQKMMDVIEGYLNNTEHTVPEDQVASLAKLFVDSTIDFDWDKRVRFMTRLEQLGYRFDPPNDEQSMVTFWSGKNSQQYRELLDAAQAGGKKVVYNIDLPGHSFGTSLSNQLLHWASHSLDPNDAQQKKQQLAIQTAAWSNMGLWSSVYATKARGDVYVVAENGLLLGSTFWNLELPVLRQLQREGMVGEIRLLDKPAHEYKNLPLKLIGSRLSDKEIGVKVRFDALNPIEQKKYLAMNPQGYQPDTLVDLNVKLGAIDGMLNKTLPFYRLRSERHILIREGLDNSFEVHSWPEDHHAPIKTIKLENPKDPAQIKAIEQFILANYENYDQFPKELHFVENCIVSYEQRRTRILAEKVDGRWNYRPRAELMSTNELQLRAYIKGKQIGESYRNIIEALQRYEQALLEDRDYSLDAIERLTYLRQQVEGYLLGHAESKRVPAMKQLLSQIDIRLTESMILAEPTLRSSGKGSFSELYSKLSNSNLRDPQHLYIDAHGDFVTQGRFSVKVAKDTVGIGVKQVMAAITREYGQEVTNAVFSKLTARDLARDGVGIDIAGLRKVHLAIERHLSPVSATLYIWKPSDHSTVGHAALQIGQGRVKVNAEDIKNFNDMNYVSWWPAGSKSLNLRELFDATHTQSDFRVRWRDLSMPVHQNPALRYDVASEEDDDFGLVDGSAELKEFVEKLRTAKGVDAKFKDVSESFAMAALANPDMLKSAEIPPHIYRPFLAQWRDDTMDMQEVAQRFAEVLRMAAALQNSKRMEHLISNVTRQFAERELADINAFKEGKADPGRVFRINLEGLDVAAMQAEWEKISTDPDARYQLLSKNCSTVVARVLKAGGAEKVLGYAWRPGFGIWKPNDLFNYGQALQKVVQTKRNRGKYRRLNDDDAERFLNQADDLHEEMLEKIAIENDGTPLREREARNPLARFMNNELYGVKEDRRRISKAVQIGLGREIDLRIAEKVTLQGEAGRLEGYYHRGNSSTSSSNASSKVILFIHGSGTSAEEQVSKIKMHYQKQGVDMLAVSMRGYGTSDGRPDENGLYQDARTMFRYLVNERGVRPGNIIIHGYSMGAPIAADLARYAARRGQSVAGLLLDRPMPSMTKAITAHNIPNPTGVIAVLAKAVNGKFSVEKNLQGFSKTVPIMLLTGRDGLGAEGEKLRIKLENAGYNISGEHTYLGHDSSNRMMALYAHKIVAKLFDETTMKNALGPVLGTERPLHNQDVHSWENIEVTPQPEGGNTRFDSQIIIQTENDLVVAKAAANLAGKHPDSSVVIQLDANGQYRVVYGDPTRLTGKLRWQIVGHGREATELNYTRMSGYSADELAIRLKQFIHRFRYANTPEHISLVGCSLISDDKRDGFARHFISELERQGIRVSVSARSSHIAVDNTGRKYTRDAQDQWVHKLYDNKIVLNWNNNGELATYSERVRHGISESDILLSHVGIRDTNARATGAIADNREIFQAPGRRHYQNDDYVNRASANDRLSYSGNVQLQIGNGEFTSINWGTTNVGIKLGSGGFKSLAFGDNNVMVHLGNGDSKHSVNIAGYQALEGAQLFIGNRNISFNQGRSNDLIVMMDKSIPTPPMLNPFDGVSRISGVLQDISGSFSSPGWLAEQESQWTVASVKKYLRDMSGLDLTSSVDYRSLAEIDSQDLRSGRGLKSDIESALNKKYNQGLGGNAPKLNNLSRADKFRQANEKLAFNFAVGGQGADIQVTTGNWNFMFGDNIQSLLGY
ncbi:RTX cytotoxin [Xenorhabdus cabanillasii JM26]|nr:RTX cytotoxin [Xenorhabdus cabanillasii JM26]